MQLVEGLKDGPPSIFIDPSKSKEQLIGGGTKGNFFPCSHWPKKKCQSWYIRGNGATHLKWKREPLLVMKNGDLSSNLMDDGSTLEYKGNKCRSCGRRNKQFHCIGKSPLIGGWTVPSNYHWIKDWKNAIDWRKENWKGLLHFHWPRARGSPWKMESSLKGFYFFWVSFSHLHEN